MMAIFEIINATDSLKQNIIIFNILTFYFNILT